MTDHNIYATEGMLWHHNSDSLQEAMLKIFQGDMALHGYPLKSFFDFPFKKLRRCFLC